MVVGSKCQSVGATMMRHPKGFCNNTYLYLFFLLSSLAYILVECCQHVPAWSPESPVSRIIRVEIWIIADMYHTDMHTRYIFCISYDVWESRRHVFEYRGVDQEA